MPKKAMLFNNMDEQMVTKEIWQNLHAFYAKLIHLVNFKYNLLIYKIVRNHYMTGEHLESATGVSKQRLYQLVDDFEEKELKRQHER